MLRVLVDALQEEMKKSKGRARKGHQFINFVKEGEQGAVTAKRGDNKRGLLAGARDWELQADIGRQLRFPAEIAMTNMRPDVLLCSNQTRQLIMLELTVPFEDRIEEAYERKAGKYRELVNTCEEKGWKTLCFPVEVGVRGFVGHSLWKALGALGVEGRRRREITKLMSETAEKASMWIWSQRSNST